MKYAVLYNALAGNGRSEKAVEKLKNILDGELELFNILEVSKNYAEFFNGLEADVAVLLVGGDGTVNRFINDADGLYDGREIFYFPAGSGNDFWHDIGGGDRPVKINEYITDLPEVTVKGRTQKFINGIGYGIDGYCCEEGDKQRAKSDKPVNYTAIAIKGLLFHYKCPDAEVTVDGVTKTYKKVWLAPTMNGRFYGGGMLPAPRQSRLNKEKRVSLVVWHKSGKLKTLTVFPSYFTGEHVKHTKYIDISEGKEITVKFSRPTALQIDGETVIGVSEYTVKTK